MKWQDDEDFCSWLLAMRYAEERDGKMFPFVSLGLVLYMHEAWRASPKKGGVETGMSGTANYPSSLRR